MPVVVISSRVGRLCRHLCHSAVMLLCQFFFCGFRAIQFYYTVPNMYVYASLQLHMPACPEMDGSAAGFVSVVTHNRVQGQPAVTRPPLVGYGLGYIGVRVYLGYEMSYPYLYPNRTHQLTPGFSVPVTIPKYRCLNIFLIIVNMARCPNAI